MLLPATLDLNLPEDRTFLDAVLENTTRDAVNARNEAIHKRDSRLLGAVRDAMDLFNEIAARWPLHVNIMTNHVQFIGAIQQGMITKSEGRVETPRVSLVE